MSYELFFCDYAVAFIDLLGQQDAMRDRQLPKDPDEALVIVKNSVGKIVGVQSLFQKYFDSFTSHKSLYDVLPEEIQTRIPDFAPGELRWQRFSDGFVIFVPLGEGLVKAPANSIFGMLMAAGCQCLTGLAAKSPLRIGIDVAWAVEYRPRELYGAALAHAYKLESKVAQWPRVVVGDGLLGYLQHYAQLAGIDLTIQARREMAKICLSLISPDSDGQNILHYLGPAFCQAAAGSLTPEDVDRARKFIDEQLRYWRSVKNEKLESRYDQVASYYIKNSYG